MTAKLHVKIYMDYAAYRFAHVYENTNKSVTDHDCDNRANHKLKYIRYNLTRVMKRITKSTVWYLHMMCSEKAVLAPVPSELTAWQEYSPEEFLPTRCSTRL
jgi:hypothetical protein